MNKYLMTSRILLIISLVSAVVAIYLFINAPVTMGYTCDSSITGGFCAATAMPPEVKVHYWPSYVAAAVSVVSFVASKIVLVNGQMKGLASNSATKVK